MTFLEMGYVIIDALSLPRPPSQKIEKGSRPAHCFSDKPVWFQTPWPRWSANGRMDALGIDDIVDEHNREIKTTWLRHACALIDLPPVGSQGLAPNTRLASLSEAGAIDPPWKIEDVSVVDVVTISLNRYDWTNETMDAMNTMRVWALGLRPSNWFSSQDTNVGHSGCINKHQGDVVWGFLARLRDTRVLFDLAVDDHPASLSVGPGKTLWLSWGIEGEGKRPACPVFKEIEELFSGFDLTIPTGTWILMREQVTDPPKTLAEEFNKIGVGDWQYVEMKGDAHSNMTTIQSEASDQNR
ncbi:hypothetical protein EV421DRAFT_1744040 [Armillaria borealis]|uniref:Uncharacterized protein n=1 Tax=Armillaria borealis TaxID=47425 RepID=A0AA39MDP3_9AGAR|nr:hypothetical protein EV421DRAFT_1744040 [Armillaria borealis]